MMPELWAADDGLRRTPSLGSQVEIDQRPDIVGKLRELVQLERIVVVEVVSF